MKHREFDKTTLMLSIVGGAVAMFVIVFIALLVLA